MPGDSMAAFALEPNGKSPLHATFASFFSLARPLHSLEFLRAIVPISSSITGVRLLASLLK